MDDVTHLAAALRAAGCVFAEDEARVLLSTAESPDHLDAMVRRRVDGEPLEHVVGWVDFAGTRVRVGPGVFVPRRRTELLVATAASLIDSTSVLLEMCCGSGAVARALTESVRPRAVHACDIDPVAVAVATRNLPDAHVAAGDLFDALPVDLQGRVDLIVANAPYVPTVAVALMPREARDHEPRAAVDGGPDGLDVARRIVGGARTWLAEHGSLVIETSTRQAATLEDVVGAAGFAARVVVDDDIGGCVVVGTLPGRPTPPSSVRRLG